MKTILIIAFILVGSFTTQAQWKLDHYTDAFGDKTEGYIEQTVKGSSYWGAMQATTGDGNMEYNMTIHVNKRKIGIFFHMFDKWMGSDILAEGTDVYFKNSAGEKISVTTYQRWNKDGGNQFDDAKIVSFLKRSNGIVKIAVATSKRSNYGNNYKLEYKFSINANGFTNAYNQL